MFAQRYKILLLGLAVLILGLRLYEVSEEYLFRPIAQKKSQIVDLEAELVLQKRLRKRIQQVKGDCEIWLSESLPSRQAEAATLYQNWLVDTCKDASFEDVQVTPSAVEELPMDTRLLAFDVTGTADYAGVQHFLRVVERTPLLHQVSSVSVRLSESEYDDELDVQLGLQCMILDGADERSSLLDDTTLLAIRKEVRKIGKEMEDSHVSPFLVVKDKPKIQEAVTEKPVSVLKDPVKEQVPEPKPDYSDQIVQVGTVLNDERREVWVMDQRTNQQTVIREGESFDFYGLRGQVQTVSARYVVIEIKGKSYRWMLAGSLKDRESIARRKRTQT